MFKGIFSNGRKWNGEGYDFNNNLVYQLVNGKGHVKECRFQGPPDEYEYKYGLKNGIGRQYSTNKILLFEGEYLNGLRKGKEYNLLGKLLFEEEYLYDKIEKEKNILKEN